jgi:hypothetical protein
MPPRARASKAAPQSTMDNDQGAPGQSNVDSTEEPKQLADNGNVDLSVTEQQVVEIVVPGVRRYRATHAFEDWKLGEERDVPFGDPRSAGLVAAGFLVQVG